MLHVVFMKAVKSVFTLLLNTAVGFFFSGAIVVFLLGQQAEDFKYHSE